jgi:adenosylcobyric acid synthase
VNAPVIMVGDIDRGGVIAALAGTDLVLSPEDKKMIKGFIINKFRGDTNLFSEGMTAIESFTGWAGIGILPFFDQARLLPAEDILDIDSNIHKRENSFENCCADAAPNCQF